MAKKVQIKIGKKAVSKKPVSKVSIDSSKDSLPEQSIGDIQLLDTDTKLLMEISKPNVFRDELQKAKIDFVERVQKMSSICNIDAKIRVYFTFKDTYKKE